MTSKNLQWSCFDDIDSFLDFLRETNDLMEITDQLSTKFEIGALLRQLGEKEGPAALFTNIKGFPGHTITGNLMGHLRRVAVTFGVQEDKLVTTYMERKNHPISPVFVDKAPVKEITINDSEADLLRILPALTHHEQDVSPYLTCAVTFAKDPETGDQSMGMYRIQIKNSQMFAINLATPPLSHFLHKAQQLNVSMEVAVVVGPDPSVLIASVTRDPGGKDKIDIAGGFRQKPVEMTPCKTVDLKVPANAQYLIEGIIQPGDMAPEGPFGDSTGTYLASNSAVMSVSSVSHRGSAIYQALQPWSSEDDVLINLCFGSDLLDDVRKDHPFISDLHIISGTLFSHIIVSVTPCSPPEIRSAMVAILNRNPFAKRVVVVDEDINIRNYREVEWAMAMRFQPDRDLLLMSGLQGHGIDPSALPDGSTTKMGIDATFPKDRLKIFEKIVVPVESETRSREILDRAVANFNA